MPVSVTPPIPTIAPAGALPGTPAPAAQGEPGAFQAALVAVGAPGAPMGKAASIVGSGPELMPAPVPLPVQGLTGGDLARSAQADDPAPGAAVQLAPAGGVAEAPAAVTAAAPASAGPLPQGQTLAGQPLAGQAAPVPQAAQPAAPDPSPPAPVPRLPGDMRGTAAAGATQAETPLDVPDLPLDGVADGASAPVPASAPQEPPAKATTDQAAGQFLAAMPGAAPQVAPCAAQLQGERTAGSAIAEATAMPTPAASRSGATGPQPRPAAETVGGDAQETAPAPRRRAASPAANRAADPVAQEGAAVQALPTAPPVGASHAASPAMPASVEPKAAARVLPVATGHVAGDATTPAPSGPHATAPDLSAPQSVAPEARVPAPLFTQTLDVAAARHGALPYDTMPAGSAVAAPDATVAVRQGTFGADVGVAIARALDGGPDGARDALLIRLDPRHMGRIDVKMSFDDDGTLRAVVSADQPAALDMLRRESTHLDRALADAGVRADAQSLRFDGAGTGAGSQQRHSGRPHVPAPQAAHGEFSGTPEGAQPILRSLRGSGHVDLMA